MNLHHAKRPQPLRGILVGAVAGMAGAYLKSAAEPPLQTLTEHYFPPTNAEKLMIGADPTGRIDHMPPAEMIEAAAQATGHEISKGQKLAAQQMVHYTLGAGLGAAYGLLAEYQPAVTRGAGVPAGAVMYVLTHGSAVPATGFQNPPWKLPLSAVLWEAGSHLVFGLGVELGRRALMALLKKAGD
ncbi:DUF1440 domain-containing protein [Deinococcus arenicola]|uniref:DUF1440 domain-containing protein n=1 Tax=Deinococcus arenicola TaxID=2994950 RepID=A0ABU4DTR5_9DEIO|nr:DUF1440 domain-containing protein [Deinococcus sp. ZS9-10]MDV6375825.1 DUF1440 domain-containing protein [Deinococcus sp. ZS9-10]